MGLKKLWKKVRKATGLPALTLGTAAKLGAAVATGGLGAGALAVGAGALKSKLKSAAVGGVKQVLRTKAERVLHRKTATAVPVLSRPKVVDIKASTMPGGAPLSVRTPRPRKVSVKPAKAARRGTRTASGGGRKPPKGGKDLKALSASWKAAGKPGKWLDWVKSH